jgi:hypothetical protein
MNNAYIVTPYRTKRYKTSMWKEPRRDYGRLQFAEGYPQASSKNTEGIPL